MHTQSSPNSQRGASSSSFHPLIPLHPTLLEAASISWHSLSPPVPKKGHFHTHTPSPRRQEAPTARGTTGSDHASKIKKKSLKKFKNGIFLRVQESGMGAGEELGKLLGTCCRNKRRWLGLTRWLCHKKTRRPRSFLPSFGRFLKGGRERIMSERGTKKKKKSRDKSKHQAWIHGKSTELCQCERQESCPGNCSIPDARHSIPKTAPGASSGGSVASTLIPLFPRKKPKEEQEGWMLCSTGFFGIKNPTDPALLAAKPPQAEREAEMENHPFFPPCIPSIPQVPGN